MERKRKAGGTNTEDTEKGRWTRETGRRSGRLGERREEIRWRGEDRG